MSEQFHYPDCIYSRIEQHHGACACAERMAEHEAPPQPTDPTDVVREIERLTKKIVDFFRGHGGLYNSDISALRDIALKYEAAARHELTRADTLETTLGKREQEVTRLEAEVERLREEAAGRIRINQGLDP